MRTNPVHVDLIQYACDFLFDFWKNKSGIFVLSNLLKCLVLKSFR